MAEENDGLQQQTEGTGAIAPATATAEAPKPATAEEMQGRTSPSGIAMPATQKPPKETFGQQIRREAKEAFNGETLRQDARDFKSLFAKDAFRADWQRLSDSFNSVWKRHNQQPAPAPEARQQENVNA